MFISTRGRISNYVWIRTNRQAKTGSYVAMASLTLRSQARKVICRIPETIEKPMNLSISLIQMILQIRKKRNMEFVCIYDIIFNRDQRR